MSLKLGRLPARYTRASMIRAQILAMNFALLGPPPASSDDYVSAVDMPTGGDWGMMANGDDPSDPAIKPRGCCTISDCGHQIMLRTANTSGLVIPRAYTIAAVYDYLTDGTDNGLDELTVMEFMRTTGILGHTIDAHANLDPRNLDHLKWTIQLYGCSRLGIQCADSMIDQFQRGEPWEPVDGARSQGGHDVPLVRYSKDGGSTMYFAVTWGKLHPVTEACLTWTLDDGTPVLEEAHCEPADDFLRATGVSPSGLNHDQMIAEMQAVAG